MTGPRKLVGVLLGGLVLGSLAWISSGSPIDLVGGPRAAHAATAVTYGADGSVRFQRMDGFGVNANPDNWRGGELRPALDTLADTLNARIWRVEFDGFTRWETV